MYFVFIILWGLKAHLVLGYHPRLVAYARFNLKGRIIEDALKFIWNASLNTLIANVSYSLIVIILKMDTEILFGNVLAY